MQNCASIGAGAQILGTQCQKEAEMTSGAEEHGNPWGGQSQPDCQSEEEHVWCIPSETFTRGN